MIIKEIKKNFIEKIYSIYIRDFYLIIFFFLNLIYLEHRKFKR
jgi:hypothetical protein